MIVFLLTVSALYGAWIMFLWRAWKRIPMLEKGFPTFPLESVSIVVAFRNEAENLRALLQALAVQDYEGEMELVLVNDHSEDGFEQVLEEFKSYRWPLQLYALPQGESGKKKAIRWATSRLESEWVLTTDADCIPGSSWVRTMLQHAQSARADFVFGPVALKSDQSFLQEFQRMELSALIGSGAALWECGYPTMCNGANLLYRHRLVKEDPYHNNSHLASGDDEFLMHRVFAQAPRSVSFVKDREALVMTRPCVSWNALIQQKIRWASKWGGYELMHVKGIAAIVFLFNVYYALLPIVACFIPALIPCIIGLYAFRWILDGIFIHEIVHFYKKPFNLVRYVQIACIYPWYVIVFGLAGRKRTYHWKGRNVS